MAAADANGPMVGIDLGTTFSSIGFLNAYGRAEVIPTAEGAQSLPSVILFPPGGEAPVVGLKAKERATLHPERVVEFVKREMGDPDWVFPIDGRELRPQTLSSLILGALLDQAEAALGQRPTSAVITCPAYFGDLEREATLQAGRMAGLEVQAVFNEPTAAALAYGLHRAGSSSRLRALVYDLGGGTFDVSVLEVTGRRVRVLATAGEHRLGGKDWDDELLNFVAEEFEADHGRDPRDDPVAQQDLRNRCEAAKVVLSRKRRASVFCRSGGETVKVDVTRELFEELTRGLLLQTQTYLETVLRQAKLGWDEIDVVLPVGGSSHMPQVHALLEQASGRPAESAVDPDLAVVQGATYYAALLRAEAGFDVRVLSSSQPRGRTRPRASEEELPLLPPASPPESLEDAPELLALPGTLADGTNLWAEARPPAKAEAPALPPPAAPALPAYDFAQLLQLEPEDDAISSVVNVNAHSLAVLVHRRSEPTAKVMIPANSQLPATHRSRFVTINDGQQGVRVVVLEGEDSDPTACTRIGECVIDGLPPRPKGQSIEITYRYDQDGRIRVSARDVATGAEARTELVRGGSLDQRTLMDELAWLETLGT
jgi:molecular chaperone DnaK (HSP70)